MPGRPRVGLLAVTVDTFVLRQGAVKKEFECISQHWGLGALWGPDFSARSQRGDIRTETGFERMSPELYRGRLIPLSSQSCLALPGCHTGPPLAVNLGIGCVGSCEAHVHFLLGKQSHVVPRTSSPGTKAWCDLGVGEVPGAFCFPFIHLLPSFPTQLSPPERHSSQK